MLVFLLLDFGIGFGWSSSRLLILRDPYGLFKTGQLEAEVTWACTCKFFLPLSRFNVGLRVGYPTDYPIAFCAFLFGNVHPDRLDTVGTFPRLGRPILRLFSAC